MRDADASLSPLGKEQSISLGRWFSTRADRPTITLVSPYTVRASQQADIEAHNEWSNSAGYSRTSELREFILTVLYIGRNADTFYFAAQQ